jgi:hypothetical protein
MFLTETELERLTGYTHAADQRRWLVRAGWRFERDRNGHPVVLAEYAKARLGVKESAPQVFTPDYSAIR